MVQNPLYPDGTDALEHAFAVLTIMHGQRRGNNMLPLLKRMTDPFGNLAECGIMSGLLGDRNAITRQALQVCKRRARPVHRAQDDRKDPGRSLLVVLQRTLHFDLVAIVGSQKIRADQQENKRGLLQMLVDRSFPLLSGENLPIMPARNEALALQERQVFFQLISQCFILMRVGIENCNWSCCPWHATIYPPTPNVPV